MIKVFRKNDGIIYLSTAIMIILVFGLITYTLSNLLVISNEKSANLYLDAQAELAAVTGIEYGFYYLTNDYANWMGTSGPITMGKSTFTVQVYKTDEDGTPLQTAFRRVIATGITESSVKVVQVMFNAFPAAFEYACYINQLENEANEYVRFGRNNRFSGNIYIGDDVYVQTKRSYMEAVSIFVPPGHVVTSDDPFDATYQWQVFSPPPQPQFPTFDTTWHDSLLTIASSITSSSGNKHLGNLTINSAWDLDVYTDNTIFIKGNLTVTGNNADVNKTNILTTENPGYIIVDGTVTYKNNCYVGDNVVTISSGNFDLLSTNTRYGGDWAHLPFFERPDRVNEIFTHGDANVASGVVYANVEAMGDLSLRGTIYTISYTRGSVEIESSTFQGSVVANTCKLDRIMNSVMDLIPKEFITSTGGFKPSISPGSWKLL